MIGTLGNAVPPGDDYLMRRIAAVESKLQMLETARSLQDIGSAAIAPGWVQLGADGYNLTTNEAVLAQQTLAFPDGYHACILSLVGTVGAWNSRTAADTVAARLGIAGYTSVINLAEAGPSFYAQVTATYSVTVYRDSASYNRFVYSQGWPDGPEVDASSFRVDVRAFTGGGTWTHVASPTNHASLSGSALFVR